MKNQHSGETRSTTAKFVYLGAWRRRAAASGKVRNPGGQGLRRISGQRHLAALR
jgi:hypothetical protein